MRYLYVMVSRTDTGFARLIRRFTGCYYNHAAISFDCDLRTLACAADRSLFERPSGLPDVTGQYFAHTHR